VRIIDDEEYEKHENFFIVLEEPRWLKRGISGMCVCILQELIVLQLLIGRLLIDQICKLETELNVFHK